MLNSGHAIAQVTARQYVLFFFSQICCLALPRSIHARKNALWPESGWIVCSLAINFRKGYDYYIDIIMESLLNDHPNEWNLYMDVITH